MENDKLMVAFIEINEKYSDMRLELSEMRTEVALVRKAYTDNTKLLRDTQKLINMLVKTGGRTTILNEKINESNAREEQEKLQHPSYKDLIAKLKDKHGENLS